MLYGLLQTLLVSFAGIIILLTLFLLCRLWLILPGLSQRTTPPLKLQRATCSIAILLGSGGHTSEMLYMLNTLNMDKFKPRVYLITEGDTLSEGRLRDWEGQDNEEQMCICYLPRARRVGQSFLTAPLTLLKSAYVAARLLWKHQPDLLLCNGPGTCVAICGVVIIYRAFWLCHTRMLYIESFARTQTLSLTGKLLYPLVDLFVVQWPALKQRYPRAIYQGILV